MKKILIINGHPSKDGFSYFISKEYLRSAKEAEAQVKEFNLAYKNFDPLFSKYPKHPLEKDLTEAQELIRWADHVVFIYPTWWGAMPAILKGFIDRTFLSGFAFKYTPGGKPQGLLRGKSARIITTAGSPAMYVLANHLLLTGTLKFPILRYCGFRNIPCTVFHTIRPNKVSEERLEKIKKRVRKYARKDSK